jgi:hypothetical protein
MASADPVPGARRLPAVLGISFVLGAFMAASSFEEGHSLWSEQSTREGTQRAVDDTITVLTKNAVPADAQEHVDLLKQEWVAEALRRRPLRAALAITNGAVGVLIAIGAAFAMRLRPWARPWLEQVAAASAAFCVVQTVLGARMAVDLATIAERHTPAILAAIAPKASAGDLPDPAAWRWLAVALPILLGTIKFSFLLYLRAVVRRPQVRVLFEG